VLTAKEALPGLVRAVQAADGHVNAGIFMSLKKVLKPLKFELISMG
jgi:hypothetical protein